MTDEIVKSSNLKNPEDGKLHLEMIDKKLELLKDPQFCSNMEKEILDRYPKDATDVKTMVYERLIKA